jgi:hypothetical protein
MPFLSHSQQRWEFTKTGTKALGGKAKVMEWAHATDFNHLPERVFKKTKRFLRGRRGSK